MAVLLGVLVAASYGAGDFFGGLASRRLATAAVTFLAQLSSLAPLAVLVLLDPGTEVVRSDVVLGILSGATGCIGLTLLYQGLAVGRMGVVAPITGVGAAVVPFCWGIVRGERPGWLTMIGVALALAAVTLIPRGPVEAEPAPAAGTRREVLLAVLAGLAFGVVFVLLGETHEEAGLWPLVAGRVTGVSILGVIALRQGVLHRPPQADLGIIVLAGALDVGANALFLVAVRTGLLSVVGVLSSLYPAATVLLARVVLHERLRRVQTLGLSLAALGVVLIGAG